MADHFMAHLRLKSVFGDKKCAIFDDSAKVGFMNSAQDGGNTPRKRQNSTKSGKVDMSA